MTRRQVLLALWHRLASDQIGLIAAGVAFYSLLALFPGLASAMALAGLMLDPALIHDQIATLARLLPAQAGDMVLTQATELASSEALGLTAIVGILFALWSVSRAVRNLIARLNIIHGVTETRRYIPFMATVFAMSLALFVAFFAAVLAATLIPAAISLLPMLTAWQDVLGWVSWGVLIVFTVPGLALFYRFGPAERPPQQWITTGALLATVLWLAGSAGFGWYVSSFASYQKTFGALGGAVILLMWLWLSAYVVLLGAEVDRFLNARPGNPDLPGLADLRNPNRQTASPQKDRAG